VSSGIPSPFPTDNHTDSTFDILSFLSQTNESAFPIETDLEFLFDIPNLDNPAEFDDYLHFPPSSPFTTVPLANLF
jgi:hypothetical protein